jgi:hypothetical protein
VRDADSETFGVFDCLKRAALIGDALAGTRALPPAKAIAQNRRSV